MPIASVGCEDIVTVADWLADPPAPVQVTLNVVVAVGVMETDPDAPDGEKPFPVPLQELAFALVQVSVVVSGYHSAVGEADNVTVGALGWEWATCPVVNRGKTSKPSLVFVNRVLRDICRSPW